MQKCIILIHLVFLCFAMLSAQSTHSPLKSTDATQSPNNTIGAITGNIIPPGIGTIEYYLENSDYDEYYLINNQEYRLNSPIVIDRPVTLKALDYAILPYLDYLPVIANPNELSEMIQMENGADFTLIGIDIDGGGTARTLISFDSPVADNIIDGLNIVRCRLHNVTDDLISFARYDTTTLKSAYITNTFAYDAAGHGLYIKDVWAGDGNNEKYKISNITFWNLGMQFIWIQVHPGESIQDWEFDHLTGWNLSTDTDAMKEIIGNSPGGGQYNIQLTNSIFSNQAVTAEASLMFTTENSYGDDNTFEIRNIVVYDVQPVENRLGSKDITMENLYFDDPEFANPASADFTIGNTNYLTAGDDETILGALYWHPDYEDETCSGFDTYNPDCYTNRSTESSATIYHLIMHDTLFTRFDKDTYNYTIRLEKTDSVPNIYYIPTSFNADVEMQKAKSLTGSKEERTTTITVTSEDKTQTQQYNIEFITEPSGLGIVKEENELLFLYPSNVDNYLFIEEPANIQSLEIINASGAVVMSMKLSKETISQIDVSELQAGIYFVKAKTSRSVITGRFVKN